MGLRLDKVDAATAGVFGLTALVTAALYNQLPPIMATHFDAHGVPNGFMPREIGAWFGLGIGFIVFLAVRFGGYLTSEESRARLEGAPLSSLGLLIVAFLAAVQLLLLWVGLTPGANLTRPLMFLLGSLAIGIGLLLPRFPPNPLVGIRTRSTLSDEEVWEKTHKRAGTIFVFAGCATLVAALVSAELAVYVGVASLIVAALVSSIYAAVIARKRS